MRDILSGLLSGGNFGTKVGSLYRDFNHPEKCCHFMIVINVSAFMDEHVFRDLVAKYADDIRKCAPVQEGQAVLLPGEIERRREMIAEREGVSFPKAVYEDLVALSESHGVAFPSHLIS